MHRVGFFQIKRDPLYYKGGKAGSTFGYTFPYSLDWLKLSLNSALMDIVYEKPTVTIGEVFEGFPYSENNQTFKLHDNVFKSIEIGPTGFIERWFFNYQNSSKFYTYKVKYYDATKKSAHSILFTKNIAEIYRREVYGVVNSNSVSVKSMTQYLIDWVAQSNDKTIKNNNDLWDVILFINRHPVLNTIADSSPISRYYHVNLLSCVDMLEGIMNHSIAPDRALDRIMTEIYPNVKNTDIDTLTHISTPMTLGDISKGMVESPAIFNDTSTPEAPLCLQTQPNTIYSPKEFDQIYKILDRLKISDLNITYTLYKSNAQSPSGYYIKHEKVHRWVNRFNADIDHDLSIMRGAIKLIPYILGASSNLLEGGKYADFITADANNQPIIITMNKTFSDEVDFSITVGDWYIGTIHVDLALLPLSANGLTVSAS